jgi:uncharacterized protein (DUF58 family)
VTIRPTGSGLAVLGAVLVLPAAGLLLGYPTLAGLGLAGLVAVVCAAGFVAVPSRLSVTRTVSPDRVTVGEPALGRLQVTNMGRLPVPRFDAVDHLDGRPLAVPVPVVGRGVRRTVHYPVPTDARGRIQVGPVVLERTDPLGLLRRTAPLAGPATLWVHPRIHRLHPVPIGVVPDFEGRLTDNAHRGSTAFSSLREYVAGDDPRYIHWRSTARIGSLVVREHVDTNEPSVSVVLDTREPVIGAAEFEAAVELVASVVVASSRIGHAVTLSAVGENRRAVEDDGGHGLLDRLAAVRRTPGTRTLDLLGLVERAVPGGCLVVVSGAEPGLAGRLAAQRRRFSRVIVVLIGGAGGSTITRRPGLAVLTASDAADAVRTWNQLVRA